MFKDRKRKRELLKVFNAAGIYKEYQSYKDKKKIYPVIHSARELEDKTEYVFTLLNGMDPKEIEKKEYVFHQVFGKNIELDGDTKKFVLTIYNNSIKEELTYNYNDFKDAMQGIKVPIVCGIDRNGNWIVYDAKTEPNALISGEPGSGKSTQLRSIICTLIQYLPPEKLHLYLGDLKMSEFHLFKKVAHVQNVSVFPEELEKMFSKIYKEMVRRSKLLNEVGVMHVDDLPDDKKVPYILIAIDEIVMVMDNKEIKQKLVQIDSLGRALGIYNILSLQRPSHDILDTKIRSLLTVRMGYRTTDLTNAKIIGTPGSEKISRSTPGRFLLKRDELLEVQSPYLTEKKAKALLKRYEVEKKEVEEDDYLQSGLLDDDSS